MYSDQIWLLAKKIWLMDLEWKVVTMGVKYQILFFLIYLFIFKFIKIFINLDLLPGIQESFIWLGDLDTSSFLLNLKG